MRPRAVLLAVLLLLPVVHHPAPAAAADAERLDTLPHRFDTPLYVTAPPDDDRLFVVERDGVVKEVADRGEGTVRTFLDIRDRVTTAGEGGLLSLAFSPEFATDGRLWVYYTDNDGDTVVDRYRVDGSGDVVAGSRTRVIEVDQPFSNHNGGTITFAADGMLLVGLGDGGGGGGHNAQDTTDNLLGSILRLDVADRSGGGYGVPSDNPFVGRTGDDEIWAYGVRNPYRFSVDPASGHVWIADVGQNAVEEIDRLAYRPSTAVNLGWDRYEGSSCYASCGGTGGLTFPVHEYRHGSRCSITGGGVVRGPAGGSLAGQYVFGDLCDGRVRVYDPTSDTARLLDADGIGRVLGSGRDDRGDVYVTDSSRVHRVVGASARFDDVAADSIFVGFIERLAAAEVTRGCNPPENDEFCPTEFVTRQQMAAFVRRAAELPRADEAFVDVTTDNVFRRDIGGIAAAEPPITRGCNPPENDEFCPTDLVTREQMAAFVRRAAGLPRADEAFVDVTTDNVFRRDIGGIAAAGVTRGCNPPDNDEFCPKEFVTRQQMAVLLVRAFEL